MFQIPNNNWSPFFQKHTNQLENIHAKIKMDIDFKFEIYPNSKNIFRAFDLCDLQNLKVVILGQDPYHGEGEANGLCFSVNEGVKTPPSLRNIFKELALEYSDFEVKRSTDLSDWAEQGVLLVNSILTVKKDQPASHRNYGWQEFTDAIISEISYRKDFVVFIFLGNYAQSKIRLIDLKKHIVIKAVHPSPLSVNRGFFGSNVFKECNSALGRKELKNIKW